MQKIEGLMSMSQASQITPYEKGYLSLLARRGELKAQKIGKKWYTRKEWLNEYLLEKKPEAFIEETEKNRKNNFLYNSFSRWQIWILAISLFILAIFLYWLSLKTDKLEDEAILESEFSTEEIIKIPNENGSYDTYRSGKIKVE